MERQEFRHIQYISIPVSFWQVKHSLRVKSHRYIFPGGRIGCGSKPCPGASEGTDADMLVALQMAAERKRRWWRFSKREAVTSRFVQACGTRFLLIEADRDRKGEPDWQAVRRIACGESGRMLLPRGVTPPEDSGIRPFRGDALQRELMVVTARQLLRLAAIPPRFVQAAVYDPSGRFPQLAAALLPFAAEVRAVTRRPGAYEAQRRRAMEDYGAALVIAAETAALDGATLILAPDGMRGIRPRVRGLILSGVAENRTDLVGGYFPQIPSDCLQTLPEGCDAWDFLSGLYERSGAKKIASRPPLMLRIGGRNIHLKDAAWKLAGLDIGMSV